MVVGHNWHCFRCFNRRSRLFDRIFLPRSNCARRFDDWRDVRWLCKLGNIKFISQLTIRYRLFLPNNAPAYCFSSAGFRLCIWGNFNDYQVRHTNSTFGFSTISFPFLYTAYNRKILAYLVGKVDFSCIFLPRFYVSSLHQHLHSQHYDA